MEKEGEDSATYFWVSENCIRGHRDEYKGNWYKMLNRSVIESIPCSTTRRIREVLNCWKEQIPYYRKLEGP